MSAIVLSYLSSYVTLLMVGMLASHGQTVSGVMCVDSVYETVLHYSV